MSEAKVKAEKCIVTTKPTHLIAPNDKISNTILRPTDHLKNEKLFKEIFDNKCIGLKTVNKKVDGTVTVRLKTDIENPQPFERFDGIVYDGVCSLTCNPQIESQGYFTTKMVYDAMRQGTGAMSSEMRLKIEDSIDRVARTQITINYEQEVQYFRGLEEGFEVTKSEMKTYSITENLLYIRYFDTTVDEGDESVSINGQTVTRYYQLLEQPVLYRYALKKKQVIMLPFKKLKTKEVVTPDVLAIKEYLTKKIYSMKGGAAHTIRLDFINELAFRALYSEDELKDLTDEQIKKQKVKFRNKAKNILYDFVKTGYIKEYKVIKRSRKIYGFEVIRR